MKAFLHYFFGKGENIEFTNFSLAHFLPILVVAVLIYLIYRKREQILTWKYEEKFRYILAMMLIVSEMSYY